MEVVVGGQHITSRQHFVAARQIAQISTGLAYQNNSGGDVPRREAKFPEPVEPAGGNISQVEGCRTGSPDAGGSGPPSPPAIPAASVMRPARPDGPA